MVSVRTVGGTRGGWDRRRGAERILRESGERRGGVEGGEVGRRRSVPEARGEVGAALRWWGGGAAGVGQAKR